MRAPGDTRAHGVRGYWGALAGGLLVVLLAVSGCGGKGKSDAASGSDPKSTPTSAGGDLVERFNDLVSSTNTDIAAIQSREANTTDLKVLKQDIKEIRDLYKAFDAKLAKLSFPKSTKSHVDDLLDVDGRIEKALDKMQSASSIDSLQQQLQQTSSLGSESQAALVAIRTDLGLPTDTSGAPRSSATTASGSDNTGSTPAPDPCALLGASTVEDVTGQNVSGTKGSPAGDPSRICEIGLGSGSDSLQITTLTGFAAERALASDKTLVGSAPVSGVGDEAYASNQQTTHNVTVRKGSTVLRIFLVLNDQPGTPGADIALQLAKRAAPKL